jgi:hypothetical protein
MTEIRVMRSREKRQNAQENHCPNFSGRLLWESFLLAKLGAGRSRRNGDKRRREKYQNS